MLTNVFVYGTLRKGDANDHWIRDSVKTRRTAWVRGWLFDLGPYPAMIVGNGWVKGELVELKDCDEALKKMDELEDYYGPGNPKNLYERIEIVALTDTGEKVNCFVYVFLGERKKELVMMNRLLPGGDWVNRKNKQGWIPYFAYGSCMAIDSFSSTVVQYLIIGSGKAENCRVAFTRWSEKWQGGVADLIHSPGDTAEGILYLIHPDELESLDQREGASPHLTHPFYRRTWIEVMADGVIVKAFTYEVVHKESSEIPPSKEYMETILEGANLLSQGYQEGFRTRMERLRSTQK